MNRTGLDELVNADADQAEGVAASLADEQGLADHRDAVPSQSRTAIALTMVRDLAASENVLERTGNSADRGINYEVSLNAPRLLFGPAHTLPAQDRADSALGRPDSQEGRGPRSRLPVSGVVHVLRREREPAQVGSPG